MSGATHDDGSLFVVGQTDLAAFLACYNDNNPVEQVRRASLGLTDLEIISAVRRDRSFTW